MQGYGSLRTLLLVLLVHVVEGLRNDAEVQSRTRRRVLQQSLPLLYSFHQNHQPCQAASEPYQGFHYSNDWTGTNLKVLSMSDATNSVNIQTSNGVPVWTMGRWPDPVLRRSAQTVGSEWMNTNELNQVCELLRNTAMHNSAVGLAAQQCGVNARIIYVEQANNKKQSYWMFINPRIVERSDEVDMKVWQEECLVLPPSFRATVLRDAWVTVRFQHPDGTLDKVKLQGEAARALQHEYDHDRGILITDHIDFGEMESDRMRQIEFDGHSRRMRIAYSRSLDSD